MKKFHQILLVICMIAALVLPVAANQPDSTDPTVINGPHTPDGVFPVHGSDRLLETANAAAVYELTSDTLLYTWNPDTRIAPSSLTKIMTALIALESGDLSDTVTVSWSVVAQVPSNALVAGLYHDEEVTLEQLLYLMMVGSANDAACLIADHIAGSQEAFVAMMNQKAQDLGCTGTTFLNAHGVHQEGHVSTARDQIKILRHAMKIPAFVDIFCTSSYTLPATNLSEERNFYTTNYMSSQDLTDDYYDPRVSGGRTGNTDEGRRNLASVAIHEDGAIYLVVVLESESQYADNGVMIRQGAFEDTALLLDLAYDRSIAVQVVYESQILDQLPVLNGSSDVVIGPMQTVSCVVPLDVNPELLTNRLQLSAENLTAPVEAGVYVGQYQVYYGSMCVAQVPLYTLHSVSTAPVMADPGNEPEPSGFDPGALTTAFMVLGMIFAVVLVAFGGLFLIRWLRGMKGRSRTQKRRESRRRSR